MRDSPNVGDHEQLEAPSASPYLRLPLPVVAVVLFAVLAALLAFGLYANANLRPQGLIVPTQPAAQPPPATATPQPTAVPVTATPQPVAAPPTTLATATPAAAVAPNTVGPTPLVLPPLVSTTLTPAASPQTTVGASSTPLPTVEPTLAAEVGQAYEHFWRVRSQALLELDPTYLPDVMDGDYLLNATQLVEKLRSEGEAINTKVSLNYTVLTATPEMASVIDDIVDDSVYVTIGTRDPISDPVSNRLRIFYTLRYISGLWKVVESVRSD